MVHFWVICVPMRLAQILNREWLEPSVEKSPEVYYVRQKMHETGVDLFLDIHGDESIPYVFVAGTEGVPNYNTRIEQLQNQFKAAFQQPRPIFKMNLAMKRFA